MNTPNPSYLTTEKQRLRMKEYRAENPEKVKESSRKWHVEHREKVAQQQKKWRSENRDKRKEYEARRKPRDAAKIAPLVALAHLIRPRW